MKHLNLLFYILLFPFWANAQEARSISLNLYGGYTFQDRVEYRYSYGYVEDGFQYGAGLEYFVYGGASVELKYIRLDANMPLYGPMGDQLNRGDDNGAINFILLGGNRYFDTGTALMPYMGAGLGVGILETPQSGSEAY